MFDKSSGMYENEHINIDHCSWPENSIYRAFDRKTYNEHCRQLIEECKASPDYERMRVVRILLKSAVIITEDAPAHPSWDDNEFEKAAMDALFEIMRTDSGIEREDALKAAKKARAEARAAKDKRRKEIYDRIVFELTEADARQFEGLKKEVYGDKL